MFTENLHTNNYTNNVSPADMWLLPKGLRGSAQDQKDYSPDQVYNFRTPEQIRKQYQPVTIGGHEGYIEVNRRAGWRSSRRQSGAPSAWEPSVTDQLEKTSIPKKPKKVVQGIDQLVEEMKQLSPHVRELRLRSYPSRLANQVRHQLEIQDKEAQIQIVQDTRKSNNLLRRLNPFTKQKAA